MNEFTPGPWFVGNMDALDATNVRAESADGPRICSTSGAYRNAICEANARLIAAAPDLLYSLQQIISDLPQRRDWLDPDLEKIARAAIAKATGK